MKASYRVWIERQRFSGPTDMNGNTIQLTDMMDTTAVENDTDSDTQQGEGDFRGAAAGSISAGDRFGSSEPTGERTVPQDTGYTEHIPELTECEIFSAHDISEAQAVHLAPDDLLYVTGYDIPGWRMLGWQQHPYVSTSELEDWVAEMHGELSDVRPDRQLVVCQDPEVGDHVDLPIYVKTSPRTGRRVTGYDFEDQAERHQNVFDANDDWKYLLTPDGPRRDDHGILWYGKKPMIQLVGEPGALKAVYLLSKEPLHQLSTLGNLLEDQEWQRSLFDAGVPTETAQNIPSRMGQVLVDNIGRRKSRIERKIDNKTSTVSRAHSRVVSAANAVARFEEVLDFDARTDSGLTSAVESGAEELAGHDLVEAIGGGENAITAHLRPMDLQGGSEGEPSETLTSAAFHFGISSGMPIATAGSIEDLSLTDHMNDQMMEAAPKLSARGRFVQLLEMGLSIVREHYDHSDATP